MTDMNGKFTITTDKIFPTISRRGGGPGFVVSTSADNRIGIAETTLTTSKEVMVNNNLPHLPIARFDNPRTGRIQPHR